MDEAFTTVDLNENRTRINFGKSWLTIWASLCGSLEEAEMHSPLRNPSFFLFFFFVEGGGGDAAT